MHSTRGSLAAPLRALLLGLAPLAVAAGTASPAAGQAGSLDTTFGIDGLVVTNFQGPAWDRAQAVVVQQADGKIVAVGTTEPATSTNLYDIALARYNTDGSLDTTFGDGGRVITDLGGRDSTADAMVDAAGRIVVVGTTRGSDVYSSDFVALRYEASGALDPSFGSGGIATVDLGGSESLGALSMDSEGRIVLAGGTWVGAGHYQDTALVRLTDVGTLDASFGSGGVVKTSFYPNHDSAVGVAIDAADGIVVCGSWPYGELARFHATGQLDTSFGSNGRVSLSTATMHPTDIVIQDGGRILTSGTIYDWSLQAHVASLTAHTLSGGVDGGFGVAGLATARFGSANSQVRDLSLDGSGRPLITGSDSATRIFAVARFTSDGILDSSFGVSGVATTDLGAPTQMPMGVVADSGDRPIIGGIVSTSLTMDFALVRYQPDGVLDSTFGVGGVVTTGFQGPSSEAPYDVVALQADGKILVAGGSQFTLAAFRYHQDGNVDTAFGAGGRALVELPGDMRVSVARSMVVDELGRILLAGTSYTPPAMVVVRLLPEGDVDTSFGTLGVASATFDAQSLDAAALALAPDGRILVAGRVDHGTGTQPDFGVACFSGAGTLDPGFGSGGLATVDLGGWRDYCDAMALQPDGKIVLAGQSTTADLTVSAFSLVRLHPDGALDTSFAGTGWVHTEGPLRYSWASSVGVDPWDRIVIGGEVYDSTIDDFALLRYLPDGSLDASFGVDGLVTTDFAGSWDGIMDFVIDAGGGITAVGWTDLGPPTNGDFGLARYDVDGNLDPEFGVGGLVTTDFGSTSWGEQANAIAVDSRGRLVVVGELRYEATGNDIGIARYLGVASPPDLVEWLVDDVVEDLVVPGLINNGEGNSLQKKLQAAIQQLDKGNDLAAVHQVEAFISELEAKVNSGALTAAEAQPMLDAASHIVSLLTGP